VEKQFSMTTRKTYFSAEWRRSRRWTSVLRWKKLSVIPLWVQA